MTIGKKATISALVIVAASVVAASASAETTKTTPTPEATTLKLYSEGRLSLAVPTQSAGNIVVSGIGLGRFFEGQRYSVGMRLVWIPDPPENPLGKRRDYDVATDSALGPVLDLRWYMGAPAALQFYVNASAGFVYGVPNQATRDAAEAGGDEVRNIILPIFELGLGLRLQHEFDSDGSIYISPEFGFVPAAGAPYLGVNAGIGF